MVAMVIPMVAMVSRLRNTRTEQRRGGNMLHKIFLPVIIYGAIVSLNRVMIIGLSQRQIRNY